MYTGVASEEWDTIKVLADTSFVPPHEKFRSVQAVVIEHGPNFLAWETSRQAFITQSTAEAELLGYNEAFQIGQAAAALLEVLEIIVRAFHPVHASTPVDCPELQGNRVTKKVWPQEELVMDQWTQANHWTGERWMGYTFFQIQDDDGGFELVGP